MPIPHGLQGRALDGLSRCLVLWYPSRGEFAVDSRKGPPLSRLGLAARVVIVIVIGTLLLSGSPTPVRAAGPDKSEVVLVLDFSASILKDKANRDRFAGALERIADRVDETSSALVAGDTTVSIVQFAAKAADYQDCSDVKLLGDALAVAQFADCLRSVAGAYRKGLDPALEGRIGIDTNYVAAMEQAATHLPPDAVRPALILFTDGKHDVAGVPVSQVPVALDRLFGTRSPFALLPVGMGLEAKDRTALEAGLARMRIIRQMPACVSGATFDWPQVVFQSAEEAGNAVAVALQDATCTFSVAGPSTPRPSTAPAIAAVRGIKVTPRNGSIDVAWAPAVATTVAPPIVDYRVRCRAGDGDWIESKEGVSLQRTTVVEGLTNGTAYHCEVAAVGQSSLGPWTPAAATVTPIGPPSAPGKPSVEALNQALRVRVTPADPASVNGFHYECSGDNGATWSDAIDVASVADPAATIVGLVNGVAYVCRAFAANAVGRSEASQLSDAVRPCGSTLECNPALVPILGILGVVLAGGVLLMLVGLVRVRRRGYVLAVVDVVYTANLGYGRKLGIGFVHPPGSKDISAVVADPGPKADIHIRHLGGGRFVVTDRGGSQDATDGVPIVAADAMGGRHEVLLRAFNTNAASPVSSRR